MTHEIEIPIRLGRIAATLPVSDIQKSYTSYRDIFGFQKIFENGTPVGFMILRKDDAELHLSLQKDHKAGTFNVAHMMVSDAQIAHDRCQKFGLRIIKKLQQKDYGLLSFVFADRDGNRIDIGAVR